MVSFIKSFRAAFVLMGMSAICLARDPADELALPEKYTLDYPEAEQFCPPIRSTFFEVTQTFGVVGWKQFRQKPNGGFGLPVIDKVDGKNLIHVGADLGWHQVGAPVFAVANGVVRMSAGPRDGELVERASRRGRTRALTWGNLIVVEHRLPNEGGFVTTVYGHLDSKRFVQTGDVVKAGQPLGTIGRKNVKINGGYDPHLHFGVREGRMAEEGMTLFTLVLGGKQHAVTMLVVGEDEVRVDVPDIVPDGFPVILASGRYDIQKRDGEFFLPSKVLWMSRRPDFSIVGYALSTEHWFDPVAFLRQHKADTNPAPHLIQFQDQKARLTKQHGR